MFDQITIGQSIERLLANGVVNRRKLGRQAIDQSSKKGATINLQPRKAVHLARGKNYAFDVVRRHVDDRRSVRRFDSPTDSIRVSDHGLHPALDVV